MVFLIRKKSKDKFGGLFTVTSHWLVTLPNDSCIPIASIIFCCLYGHSEKQVLVAFHSTLYLLLMENMSCQLLSVLANRCHHQWSNRASQPSSCRRLSSLLPKEIARHHGGFVLLLIFHALHFG